MGKIETAPTLRTQVLVVGAGIAGAWVALKLARAGVDTIMMHYAAADRGGVIGSSARSVGAVNTSPLERRDFREFMDELGQGQQSPSAVELMLNYLPEELDELLAFAEFKKIKLGVALANGNAGTLLRRLHDEFRSAGGRLCEGWVTRIVADANSCRGVQYQSSGAAGKVLASAVVIASGGYTGLFHGSVKTNNYGTVLGQFLRAGGIATNLEFIFKHGYGKPDLGALTPTEELPGAEIYDDAGTHVEWLERELYEGRGTANHLEAFKHWRHNKDKDFFIDLTFRPLCARLHAINAALSDPEPRGWERLRVCLNELWQECPAAERSAIETKIHHWLLVGGPIDFGRFSALKPHFAGIAKGEVFRVRQIAYFSMGGIGHVNGTTNLANVFVTGEAMHDFGAHRVGGLPWGLYLALGRFLSERLIDQLGAGRFGATPDFELVRADSSFDAALLEEIRLGLYRHQERDLNDGEAVNFISWLRMKRRALLDAGRELDDAVAWLTVAEALMQSSLRRTESRGCFYRADHPLTRDEFHHQFTCAYYDRDRDRVEARLISTADLADSVFRRRASDAYQVVNG